MTVRFVGNMDEWMRDVIRRIEALERRKKSNKQDGGGTTSLPVPVAGVVLAPGRHTLVLPEGVTVVSADGEVVVVEVAQEQDPFGSPT